MLFFTMISVFAAIAVLVTSKRDGWLMFENKGDENGLGIYFIGNEADDDFLDGWEVFLQSVDFKEKIGRELTFGDRFVIRGSVHGSFRCAIEVRGRTGSYAENPYQIQFHAIGVDDNASAIELMHHGKESDEYVWIENGHMMNHFTDKGHEFILRDVRKKEMLGVTFYELEKDEL